MKKHLRVLLASQAAAASLRGISLGEAAHRAGWRREKIYERRRNPESFRLGEIASLAAELGPIWVEAWAEALVQEVREAYQEEEP